LISKAPKCVGGWGSALDLSGELTTLPRPPNREGNPHHEFLATPLILGRDSQQSLAK